jgi:hypothetical protein
MVLWLCSPASTFNSGDPTRHLFDKVPVSDPCEERGLQEDLFTSTSVRKRAYRCLLQCDPYLPDQARWLKIRNPVSKF